MEKADEKKLKNLLSDYLRSELSHAGLVMSTAKAELKALAGVGSSACSAVPRELEIEVPSTLRSGIEPEHS